eukprot:TRINITY_DN349_c0_g1_i9.p3 TRINITY_DN349_c0_g1~~TRINITY_DN349_c0_g1_i9.p3  ORF type:complete len:127 (+),score=20.24 TRINITY_DN349_c0_g1_i9:153-533(+)
MCIRDRYQRRVHGEKNHLLKNKYKTNLKKKMVKGKGTPHFGKKHQRTHTECCRCGRITFHKQKHQCAACGYPAAKLRRFDGWGLKVRGRKGQGTGRMRYMKTIGRRAKNGFRSGTMQKQFTGRKAK